MARTTVPSSLGGIKFDAIVSRDRNYTADVPTYPVESGFPVSDAVLRNPVEMSVTAFISNTPVTWKNQLGNTRSRVTKVCKDLENLYFAGKPVAFRTGNKYYTNMAITSLTIPETAEMQNAVEVQISLKQVEVTRTKTTTIPASYGMSGTTGDSGGSSSTTEEKEEGPLKKACSLLFGLFKKK